MMHETMSFKKVRKIVYVKRDFYVFVCLLLLLVPLISSAWNGCDW